MSKASTQWEKANIGYQNYKGNMLIHNLHFILRIFWGTIFIISFFFLPFWWAIFAILFGMIITPTICMIFYAPIRIRKFITNRLNIRDFIYGGIESIIFFASYYFINIKFSIPRYFLLFVILEYSINQLNRVYRNPQGPADILELKELVGFYIILIPAIILLSII